MAESAPTDCGLGMEVRNLNIVIVGAGVVGRATGIGFEKLGHRVVFHDKNPKVLEALSTKGFHAEAELAKAMREAEVIFVCVPTPLRDSTLDLGMVVGACREVAGNCDDKEGCVVAVRSTILPGSMREVIRPVFEMNVKNHPSNEIGVCYNPEFLREATAIEDFLNPTRVVIGGANSWATDVLNGLYAPLDSEIIMTSFETAEMIKIVSNAFLSVRISFFNEVFRVCQRLGIDSDVISLGASLDPRIGTYGTQGGRPFSGSCLPKDLEAFARVIRELDLPPRLIDAALEMNRDMLASWVPDKE